MEEQKKPKPVQPQVPCPVYRKCGGCQLQNLTYREQLQWKQRQVGHLLGRFAKVKPIIGMHFPYYYRNKVQAAFGMNRNRETISGVYQSSSHRIVPVDCCMLEDPKADAIIVTIRSLLKQFKIKPYDEYRNLGLLRHVLVKRGFHSGEIMVVLVTATPILPDKNHFVAALLKKHPEITTVLQNVNPYHTSLVLGENEKVLYGSGSIHDSLCGCEFRISAKSFYQVNPLQTEVLYQKAMDFAGLTGTEMVLDAYCGIGTIGMVASKQAAHVIGVELNREAVRDAIANAKRNKRDNIYFYCADAGEFMQEMAREKETADVVFMDPPRAGSDERFLSSLVMLGPKRVVYISCNPQSQQRDLLYLTQNGYRVSEIQPVDMFPHTNHIETVVQLTKQNV